jgi:hypothetical protein
MNIKRYANELEEFKNGFHLRFQKEDIKRSHAVSIQKLYDIMKFE